MHRYFATDALVTLCTSPMSILKQQLSQKLQQKLSPLQIQQIKLLELTTLELENRIDQELEENPALEEMDEFPAEEDAGTDFETESNTTEEEIVLGDYLTEEDIPDAKIPGNMVYSRDVQREEILYPESETFDEYLFNQLKLRDLSARQIIIGEYIIGNIDEDGYLRRDLVAISDDLAFQYGLDVSEAEIRDVLRVIKDLDPPGIAAASLQECLSLQLKKKEKTRMREFAISVIENYFDEFSKKRYDKIERGLSLSSDELKEVSKEILQLNPKPGNAWENTIETKLSQITPDFQVEVINGRPVLSMVDQNLPELRVNKGYVNMLNDFASTKKNQSRERKDALLFVKQKLDSAKWFIDAVKQRQNTLEGTMQAIVDIQSDFFVSGEEAELKPMILKDVSERCKYDISTISRVSNSKYVQTNYGVYPLKYFFSESLLNEQGEEVSTREVKAILKQCVENEDKRNPLIDDTLVAMLKSRGYEVARRTVAKYREQLGIPVARLRKEI